MFVLLGYLSAVLMGFILGLLGGGGSILAVPIFLYIYSYAPLEATSFSLFVVSIASTFGFIRQARLNNVEFKTGLLFTLPSLASVLLVRRLLIPQIPESIFQIGSFNLTRDLLILLAFAFVMFFAGFKMIKGRKNITLPNGDPVPDAPLANTAVLQKGFLIGGVTGFVGAGGGFLIVPVLNMLFKLPIKKAMGTSLMIISINSFIGFMGALNLVEDVPWRFLISFSLLSVMGIFIGIHFNSKVDPQKLKKGFGVFVIAMASFIIVEKLVL